MTHAKITRMTAVIGYAYFKMKRFMSLRPHDRRHAVGAIEDRRAGQIRAEHQLELPGRRWQPVLLMPGRSLMLEINIDRTVRVLSEIRTIVKTRAVNRIAHHVPDYVRDRERPEGVSRRELPSRKMQDVFVAADQRSTGPIPSRRHSSCGRVHDENRRQKRQRGADDDPLHDTGTRDPREHTCHIPQISTVLVVVE